MANYVNFLKGTYSNFQTISKDANSLYFLTDKGQIYLGDVLMSSTIPVKTWSSSDNLNTLTESGIYRFTGVPTSTGNLPFKYNTGDTFAMTVIVDSINNGICSQTVFTGTKVRKNSRVYTRIAATSASGAVTGTWSAWERVNTTIHLTADSSFSFDNITETGFYTGNTTAAVTIDSYNINSNELFRLVVNAEDTSLKSQQLYVVTTTGVVEYSRSYNGSTWSVWKKLANSYEVGGSTLTGGDKLATEAAVQTAINNATTTNTYTAGDGINITNKIVRANLGLKISGNNLSIVDGTNNSTVIATVDASAFVKDGMLDNAEVVTNPSGQQAGTYIKFTFNTSSGKQPIFLNVSSLIDTYTSGNTTALTVSGYTITPVTGPVAQNAGTLTTGGQVYTAIAATKGQDTQVITGEQATTNSNYINVKVSATKNLDNDNYTLSTTANVTTKAITSASSANNGLALANDVKEYVDSQKPVWQTIGG